MAGGNTVAQYQYDGLNRRTISKSYTADVLTETRHHFYTDQWQVIEERVGASASADRQFVWGNRYIDDLVLRDRDITGSGALNERLYGMQDANWNEASIVGSNGAVQERYTYTAYGLPTFLTDAFGMRANSAYAWEQLFAGYRWDAGSALHNARNRYLATNLGTWISRDPLGSAAGDSNLYRYVHNRPTMATDPSGLDLVDLWQPGEFFGSLWDSVRSMPGGLAFSYLHYSGQSQEAELVLRETYPLNPHGQLAGCPNAQQVVEYSLYVGAAAAAAAAAIGTAPHAYMLALRTRTAQLLARQRALLRVVDNPAIPRAARAAANIELNQVNNGLVLIRAEILRMRMLLRR